MLTPWVRRFGPPPPTRLPIANVHADRRMSMCKSNVLYSADQVDFSGRVRRHLWILTVGYAHGPDDLAVLVVLSDAAPPAAEGIDEKKSASALGG